MEGTGKPEYDKCVAISTKASLKEMMLPGLLTIGFPLVIAFVPMIFGMDNLAIAEMLGGYMAGVTVSGVLWAIFQNNAGGAWDNAKKSFEAGVMIDGKMTHKGSAAHEAAITGDTVGDPFKDTSGPSMNILIKLTCLIGLVIAPILGEGHGHDDRAMNMDTDEMVFIDADGNKTILTNADADKMMGNTTSEAKKEVIVEMSSEGDITTAVVTIETTKDGETTSETKTFTGTEEEVKAQIEAMKDVDVKIEKDTKVIKEIVEEVEENM